MSKKQKEKRPVMGEKNAKNIDALEAAGMISKEEAAKRRAAGKKNKGFFSKFKKRKK